MKTAILIALVISSTLAFDTHGDSVPGVLNYQGQLQNQDGTVVTTADYVLTFQIHDAPQGGNLVWGPQIMDGASGVGHGNRVAIVGGYFNVLLGPIDSRGIALINALSESDRYIEITVNGGRPISPRQQLVSAPYALTALNSSHARNSDMAMVAQSSRELIGYTTTNNLRIYISTSGSDENDGFSVNTPKLTLQSAINSLPRIIQHDVTLSLSPGTYSNKWFMSDRRCDYDSQRRDHNRYRLTISGNEENPSLVRITAPVGIINSECNLRGLTFSVSNDGSLGAERSNLAITSCRFEGTNSTAVTLTLSSFCRFEDVIFDSGTTAIRSGSTALRCDYQSTANFVDESAFSWDPSQSVSNCIRRYLRGIVSDHRSQVFNDNPISFQNNDANHIESRGGFFQ